MRLIGLILLGAALAAPGRLVAGPPDDGAPAPPPPDDPAAARVRDASNQAGAYKSVDLPLKTEAGYAHTIEDLEPFRHVEPHKTHFREQLEYTGPGRALPEPEHVDSVKLGFIGPLYPTVSVATGGGKSHEEVLGQKMYQGALLAIEEANARGGYKPRGIPYEFVVSNDNGLWGSSGNEIIKQAYKDKVWAILGTIDGANSHIAIRVALKCELLMMNTGDTDPTFIETNIPWVARCLGDDRQMNYLLVDYMYRKAGFQRVAIVRASNRYGRFGIREINDGSRRLGHPIVAEMAIKVGQQDFTLELERVKAAKPDAVLFWGDAIEGAKVLNQMRALGMSQPFLACDRCVSDQFVEIAGANAEGVLCGFPWDPSRDDPAFSAFRERFRARFGEEPETYAAHAFDGMNMLIWAIEQAGLNRAKIRDQIAYRTEPWPGVTGPITFSSVLDDIGDVYLAKRENGAWRYLARQDLGLGRPGAEVPAAPAAPAAPARTPAP